MTLTLCSCGECIGS